MSGPAWDALKAQADADPGQANLADINHPHNTNVLAMALVYARTGDQTYRQRAIPEIMEILETENGGETLGLGRNLAAYVIAADLIGLPASQDQIFRDWLRNVRHEELKGRTLISTHEIRPNNWGTVAGASRAAAALYLGDMADLARTAQVFKGWLGDRAAYSEQSDPGFAYGDLDWQCDSTQPVGINPPGCTKQGHSIDGVLPEEMRRSGSFTWPPPQEKYVYGGLQGAIMQAEILDRAGYDTWNWQSQALLRAYQWLHNQANFPAQGDDAWQPWLINARYGTDFPATTPAQAGKTMGWTDWTHQVVGVRETPLVSWASPQNGDMVSGTAVTIQIAASDTKDAPETLTAAWQVGGSGAWQSAVYNGNTGFYEDTWNSTSVSDGERVLNSQATDSDGNTTSDSITVTVDNINDPPVASYSSLCNGFICTFDGSSSSDPDGSIVSFDWNLGEENIGSGMTISHTFAAAGTYTVTLTVTDDEGAIDTESQEVIVVEEVPNLHVGDLDGAGVKLAKGQWKALMTITVHNTHDIPVADASVTGQFFQTGTFVTEMSCITAANGHCTVDSGAFPSKDGKASFTVTTVSGTAIYDATANHDPDGDSNGTSIVVSK